MEEMINLELGKDFLDRFTKVCEFLRIEPNLDVMVFECESLEEFHEITGMPYHTGGVYHEGVIYTQPLDVLRRKNSLEETILHELLHHVLEMYFDLPRWMEEGVVLAVLGVKPEEVFGYHRDCLLRLIGKVRYEEIPDLVDRYRRSSVERR
ncbi:MAG: hypothetical protein JG779_180 [Thermotoga sp.]|jgi:hypothetical protein|nr:hypothetical protein [Thermotoga sp.]